MSTEDQFKELVHQYRLSAQKSHLSSEFVSINTLKVLKLITSNSSWKSTEELMQIVKKWGKKLIAVSQSKNVTGNVVRRVLKMIRDEHQDVEDPQSVDTLLRIVQGIKLEEADYNTVKPGLGEDVIDCISEYFAELETNVQNIAHHTMNTVVPNEIIMTVGKSRTVETFLKKANRNKRKLQVIVVECAPFYHGQKMAYSLAKDNIETTVIRDDAVMAMMPRCSKVIVGARMVMSDGGIESTVGTHTVALAAKTYAVPVVVCAALTKLSHHSLLTYGHIGNNTYASPETVLSYSDDAYLFEPFVVNPVYDYIPPHLIKLIVTNLGGNDPENMGKLLSELYHPDDYDL